MSTAEAPKPGRVTVAVRPEALVVAPADAALNGNTMEASVRSVAFLGDHYQYELDAGELSLLAQGTRVVDGDRVKVVIPPEACTVLD